MVLLLTGHTLKDSDYTIAYHRGELLRPDELGSYAEDLDRLRRPASVLEASVGTVLRALEAYRA